MNECNGLSHLYFHSQMLAIMKEYGSEVSDCTMPIRDGIKKASVVHRFRRYNPNWFQFWECRQGQWIPKLGREGEHKRRAESRRLARMQPKHHNKK